jgi:hypothetical protein
LKAAVEETNKETITHEDLEMLKEGEGDHHTAEAVENEITILMQTLSTGNVKKDKENLDALVETIYSSLAEHKDRPSKKQIREQLVEFQKIA